MERTTPPIKVSVLTTLYNKGDYVVEAIESISNGTFQDFEILIVDDASTDDGPAKVLAIGDPRIRLIRAEKNAGRAASANRGYEAARGEYMETSVAWVIIATPLLSGPGVITTAILLVHLYGHFTVLIAGVISLAITWGIMRNSLIISQKVGNNAIDVFSKIIGMLLAAIAVEFIMRGSVDYVLHSLSLGFSLLPL